MGRRQLALPPGAAQRRIVSLLALMVILAGAVRVGAPAAAEENPPGVDYTAPTPTAPRPGGPPQGYGPGDVTIGGEQLDTRATVLADGVPALPAGIDAHGIVVADATTGQILAARDPHGQYYPASTLKTLTLLALYPQLDPQTILTATYEDASVEGSRVGIVEKGQYYVSQLWPALMLQSGNDAAHMLMAAAGGLEATTELMNDKAQSLQAFDTVAANPSGLDVAGQSSSPYDLALFMREIAENPSLRAIVNQPLGQLPPVPPKYPNVLEFGNDNQLVGSYPGAIGAKAGFTDAARHTYVAAAEQNGRTIVVSLMQAERIPTPIYTQAQYLLDWAFSTAAGTPGIGVLVRPNDPLPQPPATSDSPPSSGATAYADAAAAGSGSEDSPSAPYAEPWPLIGVLGGLFVIAIWVAAPRSRRRR